MTDRLREELLSQLGRVAVPGANLPDVLSGGRVTLRRRRAVSLLAAVAAIALVGAGMANLTVDLSGDGDKPIAPAASGSPSLTDRWTTYRDPEERFTVSYPSDWHRATETLLPHVEDPTEILSVATYELRPGGTPCAFGNALEGLGPADAFVSVSESSGDLTSRYMVTRPAEFAFDQGYEPTFSQCLETPRLIEDRFIPFRDGNRFFYAYVAIGKKASSETRDQALAILNSLSFEE